MQGNYTGSSLLRNSYGFQSNDVPILRNPPGKGFPMPPATGPYPQQEPISHSIRQMQNKIEGMETLIKKKYVQEGPPSPPPPNPKLQPTDPRKFTQFPMPQPQQPLSEQLLRGSCQNILKKFDYSNLRNTTHFNPMNKVTTHQQIRRSPQEDHYKNVQVNRTLTQEYGPSNTFLKPSEKKQLQSKHSFVSPARTPPKYQQEKGNVQPSGRTPNKYKSLFSEIAKKSGVQQAPVEVEDKKVFKSLSQIMENRQKEKQTVQELKTSIHSRIINGFQFGTALGKGKFGQVFLTRHHDTGFIAAIKKIQKKKVLEFKMLEQFAKQIRLHACLDHPNIVKFYGVFEEREDIYLVMQYLNGGTLFDYLNQVVYLPVKLAVEYLKDIIQALNYMHDKSIAHRDIKPENIVISSQGVAKLCDFGWSAIVQTTRKTYCGTFDYAPPEILQRKNYDASVDIWCIGVLTYELLQGRVPFEGEQRNVVMEKIVNVDKNKISYPVEVPPQAKEFIQCLVQKDPALRPKCHDLLKFPLFTNFLPKTAKQKKTH